MPTLKKGDIVSCGRSGWWRVKSLDIFKNNSNSSRNRVALEMVMDGKGNLPKKTPRTWEAYSDWCRPVTVEEIKKHKENSKNMWDTLLLILDPEQEIENESVKSLIKNPEGKEPEFLLRLPPPKSLNEK